MTNIDISYVEDVIKISMVPVKSAKHVQIMCTETGPNLPSYIDITAQVLQLLLIHLKAQRSPVSPPVSPP